MSSEQSILMVFLGSGLASVIISTIYLFSGAVRLSVYRIVHPDYQDRRANTSAAGMLILIHALTSWIMLIWLWRIYF